MAKVGRFVSDPRAGAYCQLTLDGGDKVLVNHDKGGFKGGRVTVATVKWWGLGTGETFFACDLDSPEGAALLGRLTERAAPGTAAATPLGALVEYLRPCASLDDLRARCAALRATQPS